MAQAEQEPVVFIEAWSRDYRKVEAEVLDKLIIKISDILPALESQLQSNSNIEEVRFVGAVELVIDRDLENKLWHGKNIVIYVKKITIGGKRCWDVSGSHASHNWNECGNGKAGNNGSAGESGGNVSIFCKSWVNSENFTINSCGGNGGKGQDGGDGVKGEDGTGIEFSKFEKEYRPPNCFNASDGDFRSYWNKVLSLGKANRKRVRVIPFFEDTICNCYARIEMDIGHEVTYSFYQDAWTSGCYFLYKGTLGQAGGEGGEGGLGGQGGFGGQLNGDIGLIKLIFFAVNGKNGKDGRAGRNGADGKNGWDMGYIYNANLLWEKLVYYGRNHNKKLKIKLCGNKSISDGIWCEYHQEYAKIEESLNMNWRLNITGKKDVQKDESARKKAQQKNAINENRILEKYSNILEEKMTKRTASLTNQQVTPKRLKCRNDSANRNNETLNEFPLVVNDEAENLAECEINKEVEQLEENKDRGPLRLIELMESDIEVSDQDKQMHLKILKDSHDENITGTSKILTDEDLSSWTDLFKKKLLTSTPLNCLISEYLFVLDKAIECKRRFKLRDTQKLSVISIIKSAGNLLAQVSTGEGKSLIVIAVAIFKILTGEEATVDVITSSAVLAKRDAEENRDIYDLFGITVAHNCNEDDEERKKAYNNHVVYGDLSNFQRDYLLDKFYNKKIHGERKFDNVIVDEVDSMLLDKGNNVLYLSHDIAGFDKLESLFVFIWQLVHHPDPSLASDAARIKEIIIDNLYDALHIEDITSKFGEGVNQLLECLNSAKIIDEQNRIVKENVSEEKVKNALEMEPPEFQSEVFIFLSDIINRIKNVEVPNYLKPFIEPHLDSWIANAILAVKMKINEDYVVSADRSGTSSDLHPNIVIVDNDTGTDQATSQWSDALHQFLQLKHGCRVSLLSLKAVFISNITFFKLYSKLYGLTGTLGSENEKKLLKKVYEVNFITIPMAEPTKFVEHDPVVCANEDAWSSQIYNAALNATENERSVLIICETIAKVELLAKIFSEIQVKNVYTYTRDNETFAFAKEKLGMEQIIISTNLAGRGTDIKITDELNSKGGLHVILSFLSSNKRVELQAMGRAARSGLDGSGQLIIMHSSAGEQRFKSSAIFQTLKQQRDRNEIIHLDKIESHYETEIKREEECFRRFSYEYEQLKRNLVENNISPDIRAVLLEHCVNEWALWLERNKNQILANEKIVDEFLETFLKELFGKLNDFSWIKNCSELLDFIHDPVIVTKLAKCLNKNFERAVVFFDRVIEKEPLFAETAHYYKAYALSKASDWRNDKQKLRAFKTELRKAAKLFNKRTMISLQNESVVFNIKRKDQKLSRPITEDSGYAEQQRNYRTILSGFLNSIDDVLGRMITPRSFADGLLSNDLSEILYEDLLKAGVLKCAKVKKNIPEEGVDAICSDYALSKATLNAFLQLYKGKNINEKEFENAVKAKLMLPSREDFWKVLIKNEILINQVKYVIVNLEDLEGYDPSIKQFLSAKIEEEQLIKQNDIFKNDIFKMHLYSKVNEGSVIFDKIEFIDCIGKRKYKTLKNIGLFSFNKTASISFPKSIYFTLGDLTEIGMPIPVAHAEQILDYLVKEEFLKKHDEHRYQIIKTNDWQLPQNLLEYENTTRRLFHYERALRKMENEIEIRREMKDEDKNELGPVEIPLFSKTERSFILDLKEQEIITPTKVIASTDSIEKQLQNLYQRIMTITELQSWIFRKGLISKEDFPGIVSYLIDKRWIFESLTDGYYYIGSPHLRISPLDDHYVEIETTLAKILNNHLTLENETTQKKLVTTLEQSRSTTVAAEDPVADLSCFKSDSKDSVSVNDCHSFSLNGADEWMEFGEKKWSLKMILKTSSVLIIGLVQIAVGAAIEYYSVGFMTHVASGLISEGVGDIIFAITALRSGHFSWSDYGDHKKVSVVVTLITCGVGAYFSRGVQFSRYGTKVGLLTAWKSSGLKGVLRGLGEMSMAVKKRVLVKTLQGVGWDLLNVGIDAFTEEWLDDISRVIAQTVLSDIESSVKELDGLLKNLGEIYGKFGYHEAKKLVLEYSESVEVETFTESVLSYSKKCFEVLIEGVEAAGDKFESAGLKKWKTRVKIFKFIRVRVVRWGARAAHVAKIKSITDTYLNEINNQLSGKIDKSVDVEYNGENERDYEMFKKEMIEEWTRVLRECAAGIVKKDVVADVLKEGSKFFCKGLGKDAKEIYRSVKNMNLARGNRGGGARS